MNARIFPDVNNYTSRYQAVHVATAGAMLVAILATDGSGFVSPKYAEQARHTHEAGLSVWHYHFCRPELHPDGGGELGRFWEIVKPQYHAGDRLVLDVERMHPGGAGELVRYVKHEDAMLHEISGVHEIAYMPDSLFRQCGAGLNTLLDEYWIASWGGHVKRLGGRRRMVAQQISNGSEGSRPMSYPGIGSCDTNELQVWYRRQLGRETALRRAAAARAAIAAK